MTQINKRGLSRRIPEAIARKVRQNSKFGCVHCRSALYQYEHIGPTFEEAFEHDPEKICLLCGGCHDRVTRGHLSKATVAADYARVRSEPVDPPFSEFDLQDHLLTIELGSNRFVGAHVIFEIDGATLLEFARPEEGSKFPELTGTFSDDQGRELFAIDHNLWTAPANR